MSGGPPLSGNTCRPASAPGRLDQNLGVGHSRGELLQLDCFSRHPDNLAGSFQADGRLLAAIHNLEE